MKYCVSLDRVAEMAIERLFLSELGMILVPSDALERSKGFAVIDGEKE